MSEPAPTEFLPAESLPAPASGSRPGAARRGPRWVPRTAHWVAELTTVFIGVYAAFLINNHATHRHERQRREQLLSWVEDRYREVLDNCHAQTVVLHAKVEQFNAREAAGEMPEVKPVSWQGDYDPADVTSLLQSGGYDLLDIETIRSLREVESTLRQLVATVLHAQQRSDALILPNLGKGPSVFYDFNTRRLREPYEWLPKSYEDLRDGFDVLQTSTDKLLAQVRAERARGQ